MKTFSAKAAVTADKLRGGYYTPLPVARFLANWVAEAGPGLLEPSCGDGRILRELAALSTEVQGVEFVPGEAEKARKFAQVATGSLFTWMEGSEAGQWDGVAGNPPYIRFGNWPDDQREPALALMRSQGLKPSKLTNAWVPFVVASSLAVRPGGRVGLVLPAEILQVTYAAQLRDYLLRQFSEVTVVTFERLLFEGILQEVVLFCGVKGEGPAQVRTIHLKDAAALAEADLNVPAAPALLHDHEKWTKYFLAPEQIELLRRLKQSADMLKLRSFASVDVGIVTGRNSFFTFTAEEADNLGLLQHCKPLVSRSAQLIGTVYDEDCRTADLASKHRTWILDAPDSLSDASLIQHVEAGEAAEVHLGYKCSIRTPWWRTPSMWAPDLFMLRQIHLTPRLTVNEVGATSTDTVHRVRVEDGVDPLALATVFHNSASFAFAEIMGRSYGGGILELEPGEAELLPIPSPGFVTPELCADVDSLVRANESEKALDLVDRQVLVERLGWSPDQAAACRTAWATLRDRRTQRGLK